MICCCCFSFFVVVLVLVALFWYSYRYLSTTTTTRRVCRVAFFHPYCNDGGGGERVLWCAVSALLDRFGDRIECSIYSGETTDAKEILKNVKKQFNISLQPNQINFIQIRSRFLLEPSMYPRFTLAGQGLGGVIVALECLFRYCPDLFLETTGHAFTMAVFKLIGLCKIACYVHYPTITQEMVEVVRSGGAAHNNAEWVSNSPARTTAKLKYYQLFGRVYGWMGNFSDVTMVNSSWTGGHIRKLWNITPNLVFPPCNTTNFQNLSLENRESQILSIGQFRPEKNHMLQLKSFHRLIETHKSLDARLVLLGSCRHEKDFERLEQLKTTAKQLNIQDQVEFCVNASFETLLVKLKTSKVGIHTMWNEHFGIGVVEFMAAGVVPVAHNSAGPKQDIVVKQNSKLTGFLAETEEEYAKALHQVLTMNPEEYREIQLAARKRANAFSESEFSRTFLEAVVGLIPNL